MKTKSRLIRPAIQFAVLIVLLCQGTQGTSQDTDLQDKPEAVKSIWVDGEQIPDSMEGLPLVFTEDFQGGTSRWELTDDDAWVQRENGGNIAFGLKQRKSDYQPKVRSPHNIALIKDLELEEFVMIYRVASTLDTGPHRDCCTFFCHQDPEHFYYVHLGARPDPHSGQIMIVNGVPRKAITENEKEVPWDDEWHTVKLVRKADGLIQIYFDDMEKPHMEARDTSFGKGRLGIGSFDDMNDFDDIRIYGR